MKRSVLLDLFLTFARIGLFTFGGGYAMIPLMEQICVEKKAWITHDDMMNVTIIAESTPGPISINCATFVGFQQAGFLGATIATIGIVLPSFIILYVIAAFLENFLEIRIIANAFKGIKLAVGLLIIDAGINMFTKMNKSGSKDTHTAILPMIIAIASFVIMLAINVFSWKISTVVLMMAGAIVSFSVFMVKTAALRKAEGENDIS